MKTLYTQQEIEKEIKSLANNISSFHKGSSTPIIMLGVLNGCFMFYSDLVKHLEIDVKCDFIRVKSYNGKKSQSKVEITKKPEINLKDHHIYIVDDIFDTGNTADAIINYLEKHSVKSITIATLVTRTTSPTIIFHPTNPSISYPVLSCFKTNEWLVGYGMDDESGYYRNYNSIFAV